MSFSDDSDLSDLTEDDDEDVTPSTLTSTLDDPSTQRTSTGHKYNPSLRPPRTSQYSALSLFTQLAEGLIDLNPEYQRGVVWNDAKQSNLIDSIFHNYYIPPIIFATVDTEDGGERKICIDGKQRLTSITQFMGGHIPHKDSVTNQKLWYPTPSNQSRKLIPQHGKTRFDNKQIVCVEYSDLTDAQEREIFQRVQLGVALTPAERMLAISGPYPTLVRQVQTKINKGFDGFLDWDHARNRDFQSLAQVVFILTTPPPTLPASRPGRKGRTKTKKPDSCPPEPTPTRVEGMLEKLTDVPLTTARSIHRTFDILIQLVQDPNFRIPFTSEIKLAPVEFVMIVYLIHMHKSVMSLGELSAAVGLLRKDVRKKFKEVRFNPKVYTFLEGFIRGLPVNKCSGLPADATTYLEVPAVNQKSSARTVKAESQMKSTECRAASALDSSVASTSTSHDTTSKQLVKSSATVEGRRSGKGREPKAEDGGVATVVSTLPPKSSIDIKCPIVATHASGKVDASIAEQDPSASASPAASRSNAIETTTVTAPSSKKTPTTRITPAKRTRSAKGPEDGDVEDGSVEGRPPKRAKAKSLQKRRVMVVESDDEDDLEYEDKTVQSRARSLKPKPSASVVGGLRQPAERKAGESAASKKVTSVAHPTGTDSVVKPKLKTTTKPKLPVFSSSSKNVSAASQQIATPTIRPPATARTKSMTTSSSTVQLLPSAPLAAVVATAMECSVLLISQTHNFPSTSVAVRMEDPRQRPVVHTQARPPSLPPIATLSNSAATLVCEHPASVKPEQNSPVVPSSIPSASASLSATSPSSSLLSASPSNIKPRSNDRLASMREAKLLTSGHVSPVICTVEAQSSIMTPSQSPTSSFAPDPAISMPLNQEVVLDPRRTLSRNVNPQINSQLTPVLTVPRSNANADNQPSLAKLLDEMRTPWQPTQLPTPSCASTSTSPVLPPSAPKAMISSNVSMLPTSDAERISRWLPTPRESPSQRSGSTMSISSNESAVASFNPSFVSRTETIPTNAHVNSARQPLPTGHLTGSAALQSSKTHLGAAHPYQRPFVSETSSVPSGQGRWMGSEGSRDRSEERYGRRGSIESRDFDNDRGRDRDWEYKRKRSRSRSSDYSRYRHKYNERGRYDGRDRERSMERRDNSSGRGRSSGPRGPGSRGRMN